MAAIDELDGLIKHLPNAELVTQDMKLRTLAQAKIPDARGVWPGREGYVDTYDTSYAAYTLLNFMRFHPSVTNAASEGTSVTVSEPDWASLEAYLRSTSLILQNQANDVIGWISIPEAPKPRKVPMNDKGWTYGDVNTDIG